MSWRATAAWGAAVAAAATVAAIVVAAGQGEFSPVRIGLYALLAGIALTGVAALVSGTWTTWLTQYRGAGAGLHSFPEQARIRGTDDGFGFPRLASVVMWGALMLFGAAIVLLAVSLVTA
ncbi:MAG: hypothetical protein ACE5EF_11455 [Dehalococcoidia bacterium]